MPAGAPAGAGRRDPSAVKEAADRYGWAESATDWRAVIERDDIDVVDICTPGHLHHDIALAALEAGKHVLVEKPLANSLAEAEAMVAAADAAARRGVLGMVGFNYRRVPALALARELIAAGRIGEVRQVRAAYLQDWLADTPAPMTWRLRRETAGSGALGDLGSHVGRPGADPARLAGDVGQRAPAHVRHLARRARPAPSRSPSTTPPGRRSAPRPARWPASRSRGWRPAARTA